MVDPGGISTALTPSSTASLSDILTSIKNLVNATNGVVFQVTQMTPDFSSGQITASVLGTLVQQGFVRLLGISIVTGGATNGGLYDAATVAAATAGAQVGALLTTPGFYNLTSMVFTNGLVAKPSTGQVVSLHYARS